MKEPKSDPGCEWASWLEEPLTLQAAANLIDSAEGWALVAQERDEYVDYEHAMELMADLLEAELPDGYHVAVHHHITILLDEEAEYDECY